MLSCFQLAAQKTEGEWVNTSPRHFPLHTHAHTCALCITEHTHGDTKRRHTSWGPDHVTVVAAVIQRRFMLYVSSRQEETREEEERRRNSFPSSPPQPPRCTSLRAQRQNHNSALSRNRKKKNIWGEAAKKDSRSTGRVKKKKRAEERHGSYQKDRTETSEEDKVVDIKHSQAELKN